ncbi:NAD(P)/FAD-dependent oxidoreductase [Aspergillus homomorphus CBS 101889]|uniref:FAD/NAD(P)-binding domain-containing protein n=1 Tax=Aspergillus homomorphus (strain CBS 101889) TaxID=1450537 RepID=A0A395HWK7_ASPHC|nr:FAD/NAD(P)-binding domain-containing protein [Aspergillus homomorphus CBS 101889]RAL11813.1 FAD/NAD(P)-binding domain-containing protein [Aspergillus homomorphus CBS 101889]
MSPSPVDVLIIGGGPAGLTAALTLSRQLHTAILFDNHEYRNKTSPYMHMIPGWDHKDPAEFRSTAHEEIARYGTVQLENVTITKLEQLDNNDPLPLFAAADANGNTWTGRKVILATGSKDIYPDIPGYAEAWGKRIYHCLFCKGREDHPATNAGVLAIQTAANIPMALHQAENAAQLATNVTIYTHGAETLAAELKALLASKGSEGVFRVDARPIARLALPSEETEPNSIELLFEDGSTGTETFLVHNPLTCVRSPLAAQLGVAMASSPLPEVADVAAPAPVHQTSVRGVFAAGDCITPYKVVAGAISSGCNAAVAASAQLVAERFGHPALF